MSLTSRTVNSTFWQSSAVAFQAVVQLMVVAVLARLLEPADFGLIAVANLVIGFAGMFTQFGFSQAIIQKKILTSIDIRVAFSLSLTTAFAMMISLLLTAPIFARFFRNPGVVPVLQVLSFSFLFANLGIVAESLLVRELAFKKLFWVSLLSYTVGYALVGISLAMLGYGVWALVSAALAVRLMRSIILIWVQSHPKRPSFKRRELHELLRYGGGITLSAQLKYVANNGDYFVIGRWLGPAALGIYQQAFNIVVTFSRYLGDVLEKVLFATASRIQGESDRLARSYSLSLSLVNFLLLPISVIIIVLAPEMVWVYLGPKWMEAVLPTQILAVGLMFRNQSRISDAFVNAMGTVYKTAARKAVFATVVVLGSLIGQQWGIVGVAVAVTFAMILDYLLVLELGIRLTKVGWKQYMVDMLPGIAMSGIVLVVTFSIATFLRSLNAGPFWVLIGSLLATLLVVATVVGLFPPVLGATGLRFAKLLFISRSLPE